MKKKIIVIKNVIVISILLIAIIFFIYSLLYKNNLGEAKVQTSLVCVQVNQLKEAVFEEVTPTKILPEHIEKFKVIGMLEIPKIKLSTYILSETNTASLKKSVTKLCGPNINEVGNFCILGHNYNKTTMFGKLKDLNINDTAILTNMYGQKVEYVVYDIFKVYPKEVKCLQQETYGDRELTLITCTTGAIKRLVVKLTEVYD